jgi:hypothetical protein
MTAGILLRDDFDGSCGVWRGNRTMPVRPGVSWRWRGLSPFSFFAAAKTIRGSAPNASDPVTRSIGSLPPVPFVKWLIPSTAQFAASAKSTTGCSEFRVSALLWLFCWR